VPLRATLAPIVSRSRAILREQARRRPAFRRVLARAARELAEALDDNVYGGFYFGDGRDPYDRMGLSGYERYDRDTSNANVAAYLIWRFFPARQTLDVGCATGFVVEALRELGVDARGTDVSQWAVDHPAKGAVGHLFWGDLLGQLPVKAGSFDLVTALETMEHLPPDRVASAIAELRRVTRGYLVATIPSFGPNPNGPGGWYQVKVKDDRVEHYESLGPSYTGPVPYDDLYRDASGEPIEGHLTIASFAWWTEQFERAGFVRCASTERRLHPVLARFGLTKYWNLYVFRVPETLEPSGDLHPEEAIADVERRFGLDRRTASPEDLATLAEALGEPNPRS
jgi:SAM-dependent methyltransferase